MRNLQVLMSRLLVVSKQALLFVRNVRESLLNNILSSLKLMLHMLRPQTQQILD